MLISIVIPVYNVEKYLIECLDSIIPQVKSTEEKIEVILIDDGSTDDSGAICDELALKYCDFIKVFHNQNQGLLMTRRFGFHKSSGEYIINCDSDDLLEDGMIKKIIQIVKAYSPDIIIYNSNLYDGKNKKPFFKDIFSTEKFMWIDKDVLYEKFLSSYSIVSMCCKCIKRECLGVNIDYSMYSFVSNGEDSLQSLEIYTRGQKICYINKELYNYRMESGMTSKFDENYFNAFKCVCKKTEQYKEEWGLENFDFLLSKKLFSCVGRAITQSRFGTFKSRKEHLMYLQSIAEDPFVLKYQNNFGRVKRALQKNHIILVDLLLKKRYNTLIVLLLLKNHFG